MLNILDGGPHTVCYGCVTRMRTNESALWRIEKVSARIGVGIKGKRSGFLSIRSSNKFVSFVANIEERVTTWWVAGGPQVYTKLFNTSQCDMATPITNKVQRILGTIFLLRSDINEAFKNIFLKRNAHKYFRLAIK